MIRRILRTVVLLGLTVAVILVLLYQFAGLRVEFLGDGMRPRLLFGATSAERAAVVAAHRAAQARAASPSTADRSSASTMDVPAAPAPDQSPHISTAPSESPSGARVGGTYWTDFRGPARDGSYRERAVVDRWPASGLTPLWKQPIGEGYASFVVANGHAFTIEQRGPREVVAAYDTVTGRELWTNAWDAAFREFQGGDGPRATPTWHDGRLFALGGQGELRVLDARTGRLVWRTNILEDARAPNLQWGMSASPLIVDNTVVVLPGGPQGRSVVAYDRQGGKVVWSALDDEQAYSSPMLATLLGVRQILVITASRIVGLQPENGQLLWEHPWSTFNGINASQPLVIGENRVFVSSGYGTGAALLELSPRTGGMNVREVWRNSRMKNKFTSSVLRDGFIYGLDEGILACLRADSGELAWKGGRYGYGQVVLSGDRLIVLTEDGELVLVRATPDRLEEISRSPALSGKTWNHPALADGILFVRNIAEMAAFDLR